jgi:predicted ATPase
VAVASVAGVEFAAAAVAAGVGAPAGEVDAQCAMLARHGQFVRAHGTATWPDGTVTGCYSFGHALYQEVVYERLPVGYRTRVHQQIGTRLELGYGEQARDIAAELAEHFVRGQDALRAVQYLQQAGENALRRSAHQAAITHLTTAMQVLETLPETPERTQRALVLHIVLSTSLTATHGSAAPETGAAYRRAHALSEQVGDPEQAFAALRGLALFRILRGELTPARALGEQLLRQTHYSCQPALRLEAHRTLGGALLWQGEVVGARVHFEQSLALYEPQHRVYTFYYGVDSGVSSRTLLALALWVLGYPDQARQRSHAAVTLAQELAHPMSLVYARTFTAMLHQWGRESALTQHWTETTIALATEHGFPQFLQTNAFLLGWALAQQGQVAEGLTRMRQSLDAWRAMGADLYRPYSLALLAEADAMVGHMDEGLQLLDDAFAVVRHTGEGLYEAELYRLHGELLRAHANTPPTLERAEVSLQHALAISRQQQAKSLELRTATSLARLWQQQGKRAEACELLAPIYGWFTEGLDTADLRDARALLEDLAWESPEVQREPRLSPCARNGTRAYSA